MSFHGPATVIQGIYRVLLGALSHPGRIYPAEIPDRDGTPGDLMLAVAACLLDHEVTFALTQPSRSSLAQEIAQCSGAAQTITEKADFIFVEGPTSNRQVAGAKRGTDLYPDRGATVIYQVPAYPSQTSWSKKKAAITLSGPGISASTAPQLVGLDPEELLLLRSLNESYPLGVDAFFLQGNRAVMGLPRSTQIEVS